MNPQYTGCFVFNNDYPALMERPREMEISNDPLFQIRPATGVCRVMCFHPKSNLSMGQFNIKEIMKIIEM